MKFLSNLKNILATVLMNIMCWCGSKLFKFVDVWSPKNIVQGITFSNNEDFIDYVAKFEKPRRKKR